MKLNIKPYHKFNGGMGATLCNNCGKMISEGMTKELYCEPCSIKTEFKTWMEDDEEEDEYSDEYT